jgi:hypothetical protein
LPRVSTDNSEGQYRKPRANLYTALLAIALVALILGCVLLYFELEAYEFKHKGAPSASATMLDATPTVLLARASLASTDRPSLSTMPKARMSTDARTPAGLLSL